MASDVGLDVILKEIGAFGKYNIINYALLLFPIYLAGMYGTVYVFEAPDIEYRCKVPQCEGRNDTAWHQLAIPYVKKGLSKCTQYSFINESSACSKDSFNASIIQECIEIVYSNDDSVIRDFELGCQDWKRTLVGSFHNIGFFVSLPLTGVISDKYGRKLALSIAGLMNGIFGVLRSFSTSYIMLLMFEFLEVALGGGAYTTAFVLAMELVGPKGRVFGNTLINVLYVMGLMTLTSLSWYLQSWRHLLRIIYTPAVFVFSYYWLLNESVRWLLSKGRHVEAAVILKKAARMNNVDLSDNVLTPIYELEKLPSDTDTEKPSELIRESVFKQVIKSTIILKRVAVCSFLWMTCTFVYNGLAINSVMLAGNKYINFMLVAFVEIPANFTCMLVLDRFGRKRVLTTMYLLSGVLCITLPFIPKGQKWWSLIIYLSGKYSITVAYSTVYIYVSEVFPTSVRQSLLAVCSSLGRVGSTLAPLTPLLALTYENLPAIFFGSLALTASVMVCSLPETINQPLPDTIEEAEKLSRRTKDRG